MTVRQRTASEAVRKDQILRAARKVFREKGYESTTVSDIVNEAGVAQGTFYLYFPSKKHVIVALAQQPMDEMARKLTAGYSVAESLEERLRMLVRVAFQVGRENPDLCRLLHMGGEAPAQDVSDTAQVRRIQMGLVAMLQGAVESGEMAAMDPEIATRLLMRMMHGAMQETFGLDDGRDADRLEATMTQIVVNAFMCWK